MSDNELTNAAVTEGVRAAMAISLRGCDELLPQDDWVKKLTRSAQTGTPLRIKFGMDSAKTYLKDRENRKFADYLVKTEAEGGKTMTERGYGNTVVAFQRYPNGQPYAVYASPQENLPRVSPLAQFDSQMPLTSILPEDPKAPKQEKSSDNEMSM